jgi:heavy-metal resistance protein
LHWILNRSPRVSRVTKEQTPMNVENRDRSSTRAAAWVAVALGIVALWAAPARAFEHVAGIAGGGLMQAHFPGGGPPPMGDGPGMMLPLLLFSGELNDDQMKKVHEIMEGNRETISGLFSQLHAANDELAAKLLAPGTVSQSDLAPTLAKIAALRQKLVENGASVALQIRGLMTADQIAKASQVRQRLEQLDEERRQLLGKKDFMFITN